ncbi:MAG: helix-turn-helix domain-containing protein [Nitrososphaera sp.]|nr:helix-turn-helix domain-containing protein [Nitrososphaera sp.]
MQSTILHQKSVDVNRDLSIKFGNRVRKLRQVLGISQETLAERAGVHRTYVGMIERGEKNITLSNISKFASALEVTMAELLKLD